MNLLIRILILSLLTVGTTLAQDVRLHVLGSGGPEIDDGRASTSYLITVDGKAKVLVDAGPGSAFHFEKTKSRLEDLEIILLSHLHADHSSDLPAFVKGLFFRSRTRPLKIVGPKSATWFPSTTEFVESLFAENNSNYPYLSDYLAQETADKLIPLNASHDWKARLGDGIEVQAARVNHGSVPALAWRVEVANKSIVFSGDFSGQSGNLAKLAQGADILVCHNAVPERARGLARRLHAPPSVIGETARAAKTKFLLLSHRMKRTSGNENETLKLIRESYQGPVEFADDLDSFEP